MTEVVVVCFEEEWFILDLFGETDEFEQVLLCELASPLVVYVNSSDAVAVEGGGGLNLLLEHLLLS